MAHPLSPRLPAGPVPAPATAESGPGAEIELTGFSGARILLIRSEGQEAFVRKISAAPAGNVRLQAQAIKQRLISGLLDGCARTPRVLDEGILETGLYFFDMEFVRGRDGIAFLRSADLPDIVCVVDRLLESLTRLSGMEDLASGFSPRTVARMKCREILDKTGPADQRAQQALHGLLDAIERVDMPDRLAPSACHGDMTLENILITDRNELIFIDLLDSFFDHWLADAAKLEQDLKAGWYTRHSPPLPAGVTHYVQDRLNGFAGSRFGAAAGPLKELLLGIHLARIIPYAHEAQQRDFVLARLEDLLARTSGDRL